MPIVGANGIEIWYDEVGDPADPALLLIGGLGAHATGYAPDFCSALADRGVRVIRFDNRDMGFSTHDTDWSYTLSDMAADAVGLLDALDIQSAHLWGSSMGGMIAQTVAIEHRDRVQTLISVMSTTGEPDVGVPDPEILGELIANAAPAADVEESFEQGMRTARLIGSPGALFDEAEHRRRQSEQAERNFDPFGTGRQLMAVITSGSREAQLVGLEVPTLVIHGDSDPLVSMSGGQRTAELIPGAQLEIIEGMGHDLPPGEWARLVSLTISHIATHHRDAPSRPQE